MQNLALHMRDWLLQLFNYQAEIIFCLHDLFDFRESNLVFGLYYTPIQKKMKKETVTIGMASCTVFFYCCCECEFEMRF